MANPRAVTIQDGSGSEEDPALRRNNGFLDVQSKRSYNNQSSEDSDPEVESIGKLLTDFKVRSRENGTKKFDEVNKNFDISGQKSHGEPSRIPATSDNSRWKSHTESNRNLDTSDNSGWKFHREFSRNLDNFNGRKSHTESSRNPDTSDNSGWKSHTESSRNRDTSDKSGRKSHTESNGNPDISNNSGRKSHTKSSRNPNTSDNSGWKSHTESSRNRDTSDNSGRKSHTESNGNPDTSNNSGRKSHTESSRSPNTSENSGRKSYNEFSKGNESSAKHKKATKYTKEQREAITRVRKCPKKDYYAILDLEEDCSETEIKKAYRALSLLTHPDKNRFDDSEKAFKLISTAYQVLGNSSERRKYDKNRARYKMKGEFDAFNLWDEEFADNASGTDSGSESDGDDSEEEGEEEEPVNPGPFIMEIYQEATPFVRRFLADPYNSSAKSEIQALNKVIRKQNNRNGRREDDYIIPVDLLRYTGVHVRDYMKAQEKDPESDRAWESQERVHKQFGRIIQKNSYPREWLEFLPWKQRERDNKAKNPKEREKGKGREKPASSFQKDADGDTSMHDAGPSYKKKRKDRSREATSSSGQEDEESDTVTKHRKWKPGQETRKGEKILGWRPFFKTDRKTDEQVLNGCQLVIEKKGQPNPVDLVSGEDVGRRVVDAYRDLPLEEQNDIRYSEKKYTYKDAGRFDQLLGFACKPLATKTKGSGAYYPVGYALYSFTDGSQDIVSRECLRQVFGKKDADNEIAEFYDEIGETPPWLIKPKMLLTKGTEVKRRSKSRRADSDDESDSDSESDSARIFVSSKKRGKRYSRYTESSDDESSSDDDANDRQGRTRKSRERKRNSKKNASNSIEFNNQNIFLTGIFQKIMKQMDRQNDRQDQMSRILEEALRRGPGQAAF